MNHFIYQSSKQAMNESIILSINKFLDRCYDHKFVIASADCLWSQLS